MIKASLASILSMPVMEKLDPPPIEEELSKTIDSLANGKALGLNGSPAELIQDGKLMLQS